MTVQDWLGLAIVMFTYFVIAMVIAVIVMKKWGEADLAFGIGLFWFVIFIIGSPIWAAVGFFYLMKYLANVKVTAPKWKRRRKLPATHR
jgi:hypothetical protein